MVRREDVVEKWKFNVGRKAVVKRESHYGDKLDIKILPNEGSPITDAFIDKRADQEENGSEVGIN